MPLVKSSHLRSVVKDKKAEIVNIRFHDGSIYEYDNVTSGEYKGLLNASSKGKYFWKYIRQDKPTRKIREGMKVNRRKSK